MKFEKFTIKILMFLMFFICANLLKGQNNCSTAIDISSLKIDSTLLCSNSGSKYWFKLNTYYSNYIFIIDTPSQTPFAGSKSIKIFSGNCNNLIYNNEDTNQLLAKNLIVGQDYYIVVDKA